MVEALIAFDEAGALGGIFQGEWVILNATL